jgi:regulator of protease activity HflC (stomatin/prohibitin superfamily)
MDDADRYKVLKSGRYWASPCKEYFKIPLREQRAVWTESPAEGSENDESISFAAVDGQKVNIDVGIGYQIPDSDDMIVKMIRTYGPNLERTIDQRVRDQVRHNLNTCSSRLDLTVQDVYGSEKDELFACAESALQKEFNPNGLIITRLTLNSDVRLPDRIRNAMERAQAATQEADQARRELEKAHAVSEKSKIEAEAEAQAAKIRAEGEAEANRIITRSLTPEVLKLRALEIQMKQAESWDGELPDTVMGGDIPFVMVRGD